MEGKIGGIILAGGAQTRMDGLLKPKCLVEFGGQEFLKYLVSRMIVNGVRPIYVLVSGDPHHRAAFSNFEKEASRFGVRIIDSKGMGTGADLGNVFDYLKDEGVKHVLIANGDTIVDLDLSQMIAEHVNRPVTHPSNQQGTIALTRVAEAPNRGAFAVGSVNRREDNSIYASREAFDGRFHVVHRHQHIVRMFASSTGTVLITFEAFRNFIRHVVSRDAYSLEGELLPSLLPHIGLYSGTGVQDRAGLDGLSTSNLYAFDCGMRSFADFGTAERLEAVQRNIGLVTDTYGKDFAAVGW